MIAVVVAGLAAGLFFLKQQAGVRQTAAAEFLPPETLLLAELPDLRSSGIRWRETAIFKIMHDPEVQAFLEKPRSKVPKNATWDEITAKLREVQARQAFVALTSISDNQPRIVGGFSFGGKREDVESLVSKARAQAQAASPAGKRELVKYQEFEIETFSDKGVMVAGVFATDWYFAANDLELLKSTLDRFTGKTHGGLTEAEAYRKSAAHLPSNPDARLFVQPAVFFEKVLALSVATGQMSVDPQQAAQLRTIKALAGGVRLEGERIRDTFFVLQPDGARLPSLSGSTLSLTTPETILYYAFAPLIPDKVPLLELGAALPPALGSLRTVSEALGGSTATMTKLKAAFGPEYALLSDWPNGVLQPTLGFAVQIRDGTLARQFVDAVFTGWKQEQADGFTTWSAPAGTAAQWVPSVALTDKHFLIALNPNSLRQLAARTKAGGSTIEKSTAYSGALSTVAKPQSTLAYLDAKALFERLYGWLRPMAMMGIGFVPNGTEYVDIAKLPSTEAVSRHLQPIILSGAQLPEGILYESTGPVTFYEATVGLVAVGTAIAIPMIQSKSGLPGMGASNGRHPKAPQSSLGMPVPAPAGAPATGEPANAAPGASLIPAQ